LNSVGRTDPFIGVGEARHTAREVRKREGGETGREDFRE